MKKFYFALDTVLNYKEQVLEDLQNQHAQIIAERTACERVIEGLEQEQQEPRQHQSAQRQQRRGGGSSPGEQPALRLKGGGQLPSPQRKARSASGQRGRGHPNILPHEGGFSSLLLASHL